MRRDRKTGIFERERERERERRFFKFIWRERIKYYILSTQTYKQ